MEIAPSFSFAWNEKIIPVQYSVDHNAIEEKLRALNGTIEELNFQILQMQDQLQRMQKDNEFRFQKLEEKLQVESQTKPSSSSFEQKKNHNTIEEKQKSQGKTLENLASHSSKGGAPERNLGTVVFDANGNVIGGSVGDRSPVGVDPQSILSKNSTSIDTKDPSIAMLNNLKDSKELYRQSYKFILSGQYKTAEIGFRRYVDVFSSHKQVDDAYFWLGESLLAQGKYNDAAEVFLSASKKFPKSVKAPDMLLKLGVSLSGLGQNKIACETFSEITKRYPDLPSAFKEKIKEERSLIGC